MGLSVITLLSGINQADQFFGVSGSLLIPLRGLSLCVRQVLLRTVKTILEEPEGCWSVKSALVNLLAIVVTATDNLNQNILLEYFMQADLFTSLTRLLHTEVKSERDFDTQYQALQVLSLLSYFQKFEQINTYSHSMRQAADKELLQDIVVIFEHQLEQLKSQGAISDPASLFERFSTFVSFWSAPTEEKPSYLIPGMSIFLLCLYDWVHENAPFRRMICGRQNRREGGCEVSLLLRLLLQFAAGIFAEVNHLYQACYTKMCMIILLCLTEDQDCAYLLHDPEIFSGVLSPLEGAKSNGKQPVICTILDLCTTFNRDSADRSADIN